MSWARGWGPEFEKHLRKTDPSVIEVTWEFLLGLGRRQCVLTLSSCRGLLLSHCCLVPSGSSSGWVVMIWPSPVAPKPAEEVLALFPLEYHPVPEHAAAPQLDNPLVRQLLCGVSVCYIRATVWVGNTEFSFLFRVNCWKFLGPRQESDTVLEAKAAAEVGGDKDSLKHCTSCSTSPCILRKM